MKTPQEERGRPAPKVISDSNKKTLQAPYGLCYHVLKGLPEDVTIVDYFGFWQHCRS
jgi:hypothetical protein